MASTPRPRWSASTKPWESAERGDAGADLVAALQQVVGRHRLADPRDAGPGVVDQYEVVYGGHGGRR